MGKEKDGDRPADAGYLPRGGTMSKVEMYGWVIEDSPGRFRQVEKELLNIDKDYQRERVVMPRVLEIAANWSWVRLGVLHVAERPDGTLWVFDGQHRKLGADRRSDITKLPCMVYKSAGSEKEAGLFLELQRGRSPLRAIDVFRAQLKSGDPIAVQVDAMVRADGYRVARNGGRHSVQCVGRIYRGVQANPAAAKVAWDLCVKLYDGDIPHEAVFSGLFYLEHFLGRQDPPLTLAAKPLAAKVQQIGPAELLKAIHAAKAYHGKGGERLEGAGVAKAINKGRSANKIPSPITED